MRVTLVAGSDPGHLFPAAGLAMALRDRGHEALVVSGMGWVAALRRDGLGVAELPLVSAAPRDGDLSWRLYGQAAQMARPLADVLRGLRPDLVVSDLLLIGGGFAAELSGLPWVELIPHAIPDQSRQLPPTWSGLAPGRGPLGRARDTTLRRLTAPTLTWAARQLAAARRQVGLPPAGGGPAARLVAALPALELPRPDWPAGVHLVGPLEWDPCGADLAPPPGRAPLVFLSASTVSAGAPGLLGTALAGLAGLGVRLVSTQFEPYEGWLPPWAAVGPGRQAPLLDACALVVSGAGHGILAKALIRGRPAVAVPGGGDQRENAARLRRLGAGRVLRPGRLTPPALAAAVRAVLDDPSHTACARRIAVASAGLRPGDAAVDVLESVLAGAV